jgi:hypothetical protein
MSRVRRSTFDSPGRRGRALREFLEGQSHTSRGRRRVSLDARRRILA